MPSLLDILATRDTLILPKPLIALILERIEFQQIGKLDYLKKRIMEAETFEEASEIEKMLWSLTTSELKELCKLIGVRYTPNKKECIDYILNTTVRARARHELLKKYGVD